MVKRDIHVSDITPFDPKPTRTQVDEDHRYIEHLLNRSQIPPLDGAVPQPNDYYSLGVPQHPERPSRKRPYWEFAAVFGLCLLAMTGVFHLVRALVAMAP